MKTENEKKRRLIFSIVLVLAAFAFFRVSSAIINICNLDYYIASPIKEGLFLFASSLVTFKLHKSGVLQWKKKGWGSGLLCGLYAIILSIINIGLAIFSMWLLDMAPTISGIQFLSVIFVCILIGITEELLFRGVLQNSFHDFFGENSVSSVRKAIICSSLVFGFLHIFNAIAGVSLTGSFFQMLNAIPTGMIFGTIYYRTGKNLWVCAFLHAFWDLAGFMQGGVLLGATTNSVISNYSAMNLAGVALQLIVALFLMRKKKLEKCIVNE